MHKRNRFEVAGNLTKNDNGTGKRVNIKNHGDYTIAEFKVAVDSESQKGQTEFLPCKAWNKVAERIEKLQDCRLNLEGYITTESYDSKKYFDAEGKAAKFSKTYFVVTEISVLTWPKDENGAAPAAASTEAATDEAIDALI